MKRTIIMLMLILGMGLMNGCKNDESQTDALKDGCKKIQSRGTQKFQFEDKIQYYYFNFDTSNSIRIYISKETYEQYGSGDTYCHNDLKGK